MKIKELQGYRSQKRFVTSVTFPEKLQKLQKQKATCNLVNVANKGVLQKLQRLQQKNSQSVKKMKTITQAKPKKKLSAFFDQFTDKDIKAEINEAAEKEPNLVSAVNRSSVSRESFKNTDDLADFKSEKLHEALNRFITDGITFDVSADDFQMIDPAERLKASDKEFLKLNGAAILCTLQQSLLMKHLFSHSPEQFEDFAFEITERECLSSPLRITDKTRYEIYFEAVKSTTRKWFADLLLLKKL